MIEHLSQVKELRESTSTEEVSALLQQGWTLLDVNENKGGFAYCLGREDKNQKDTPSDAPLIRIWGKDGSSQLVFAVFAEDGEPCAIAVRHRDEKGFTIGMETIGPNARVVTGDCGVGAGRVRA